METMTKEEKQALLTKQYQAVLDKELAVYDNAKKAHSSLTKEIKKVQAEYTKQIKAIDAKEKKLQTTYKNKVKKREETHQTLLNQIAVSKEEVVATHAANKETIEADNKAVATANKKQLTAAKKDLTKQAKDAEKEHVQGHEKADKTIVQIKEKGVKDQATFDQKLNDLKTKFEAKIESLNDKEQTKKAKLIEAHEKKVQSVQEAIQKEQEKHDKNLAIVIPTFEEELEEIDEKIALEQADFDKKYANIKTSSDKRIAVREKHMQRALSENDNRSAKQHKKDIAKFRKEAEKDLAILEKNYNQQKAVSADYRINFIKEHYANLADLERKAADIKEQKQLELDQLVIAHTTQLEQTTQEYNQLRADELKAYNENYAATREKQENVKHQELIDIEEQNMIKLQIDHTLAAKQDIIEEETKTAQEEFDKAERLREKDCETKLALNDNNLSLEQAKLDAQIDVAELEKDRDINNLDHEQAKEKHTLQDERHNAQKESFHAYQLAFSPALVSRVETLTEYHQTEVKNRTQLELKVLLAEQKELEKDHKLLVTHIDETFNKDKVFYEEHINALAGPKQEELDAFIQENQTTLLELKNKIEQLTDRKDRRERHQLEEQYQLQESSYKKLRTQKEEEIQAVVGVYQDALNELQDRHEVALKDANDLYNASVQAIEQQIEQVEQHETDALAQLEQQKLQTEEQLNTFTLQAASRNQQHATSNQTYLDRQLAIEDGHINDINNDCEAKREARNTILDQTISEHNQTEQSLNQDNQLFVQAQNQEFESYQQESHQTIQSRKQQLDSSNQEEQNTFNQKKAEIVAALDQELSTIRANLDEQTSSYNQTVQEIEQAKLQATNHLEDEQKRVQKEYEERLKQDYDKIAQDQQTNIQSMN